MRLPRKRLPLTLALSAAAIPLPLHTHQQPRSASGPRAARTAGARAHHHGAAGPSGYASGSTGLASAVGVVSAPVAPQVGALVHLAVSGAPAGISDYRWDLTGDGSYAGDSAQTPAITTQFTTPGEHRVSVELQTGQGWQHAAAVIEVSAATPPSKPPAHRRSRAARTRRRTSARAKPRGAVHELTGSRSGAAASTDQQTPAGSRATGTTDQQTPAGSGTASTADQGTTDAPGTASGHRSSPEHATANRSTAPVAAHAAGDPAVAIVDFSFSPGSTTVHVGDTISWTNNGSAPHSATAHDGSFDTGILKKGQSGSHTFTHAGTFSYFCSVHPFMHGTVVVLASSSGSQTGGSQSTPASGGSGSGSQGSQNAPSTTSPSATPTPTAPPAATSAGGPSLPLTGMSLTSALVVALSLLGGGLALRRLASRQR